jgi:hypothetical protein
LDVWHHPFTAEVAERGASHEPGNSPADLHHRHDSGDRYHHAGGPWAHNDHLPRPANRAGDRVDERVEPDIGRPWSGERRCDHTRNEYNDNHNDDDRRACHRPNGLGQKHRTGDRGDHDHYSGGYGQSVHVARERE